MFKLSVGKRWKEVQSADFIGNCKCLILSWPAGHICPTYKESFQVRWGNSVPLFPCCHLPWSISIPLNQSECIFPRNSCVQMILCAMLHSSIAHNIICTVQLFRGKMHSDWFNGIEILQGRWQHGEKVGYCYPRGLGKTLFKWDTYVPLVMKGLKYIWWLDVFFPSVAMY